MHYFLILRGISAVYYRDFKTNVFKESSSGADNTLDKINSFAFLPEGWHFGEGKAPSKEQINSAIKWYKRLRDRPFRKTNAFAGANGEIQLTAYHDQHYVELIIEIGSAISVVYEDGLIEVINCSYPGQDAASKALDGIMRKIWSMPVYYTPIILTVKKGVSQALRSGTLPERVEYPLYKFSASVRQAQQYANMCENTIRM
jgi:hypothetical protein